LNANWTSQTHSAAFGPTFDQLPEPEPPFSSAFTRIIKETGRNRTSAALHN
jgi:hypothetical protein